MSGTTRSWTDSLVQVFADIARHPRPFLSRKPTSTDWRNDAERKAEQADYARGQEVTADIGVVQDAANGELSKMRAKLEHPLPPLHSTAESLLEAAHKIGGTIAPMASMALHEFDAGAAQCLPSHADLRTPQKR